jgi:hypothetical protein
MSRFAVRVVALLILLFALAAAPFAYRHRHTTPLEGDWSIETPVEGKVPVLWRPEPYVAVIRGRSLSVVDTSANLPASEYTVTAFDNGRVTLAVAQERKYLFGGTRTGRYDGEYKLDGDTLTLYMADGLSRPLRQAVRLTRRR